MERECVYKIMYTNIHWELIFIHCSVSVQPTTMKQKIIWILIGRWNRMIFVNLKCKLYRYREGRKEGRTWASWLNVFPYSFCNQTTCVHIRKRKEMTKTFVLIEIFYFMIKSKKGYALLSLCKFSQLNPPKWILVRALSHMSGSSSLLKGPGPLSS